MLELIADSSKKDTDVIIYSSKAAGSGKPRIGSFSFLNGVNHG